MIHFAKKSLLKLLSLCLLVTAPLAPVQAAIISTEDVIASAAEAEARDAIEARVGAFLVRDDVREQLITLGVDPDSAAERVQSLTLTELKQLDGRLDQLPAGAGVLEVIGFVMLVLIILEVVGVIDVFKGV
jgi:hypothetical protein